MRTALVIVIITTACQQTAPGSVQVPADSAAGEVPFELARGDAAIVVPVTLNGAGPFDFVLDTGATLTCVDQTLADSLGMPPLRGAVGMGAGAMGVGQLRLVEIDSVRVGNAVAEATPGCVLDLAHLRDAGLAARGLLGLNFLKAFRVTVDFDRSVLILQAP
jgi:predicted aspartyl protease